jgi:hypothetical protein
MGVVKKILAKKSFAGASFFHDQVRVEVAEAVHVHWRDSRILATPDQFTGFVKCLANAHFVWDGKLNEDDTTLSELTLSNDILFNCTGVIEEQENGIIHFHYQDLRIEMTPERFLMLARLFEQAKREYNKDHVVELPLDKIDPYDPGHFDNEVDWRDYDRANPDRVDNYDAHVDGIKKVIDGIESGRNIRPIAVKEKEGGLYKRYDGFKRYMAYKLLNRHEIPCYIMGEDVTPGCQDGQPWFLE